MNSRRHVLAMGAAIFLGMCAVTPILVAPQYVGNEYRGIQYLPLDNEESYRARIHEILDGHFSVAQPYLFEYKSAPVAMFPLNEWLYALPAFVFGISAVIIASKFLLPAALFFLAYLLLRRLIENELTAIAGGLLVFFSVEFVDYGYMLSLLHGGWPRPLLWTRPVNPIVGAVEVFAFLNLLWATLSRSWRYAHLAAGIVLALSVGYYFSFGICAAVLGVAILTYLYRREWDLIRKLGTIGALALVLTIPYWYSVLQAIGGSSSAAMRNGMFFTHASVFNKSLFAATVIVLAAFAYAQWQGSVRALLPQWIFVLALTAAGWIAFNEQVLTGREIWHHHFVQYTTPLAALALITAGYLVLHARFPRLWKWGAGGIIAACLLFGLYSTLHMVPRMDTFEKLQEFGAVTKWLNDTAVPDCVVLVRDNDELARYIPAYSGCNVYTTTYTFATMPEERLTHNFLVDLWLLGVAPESVDEYLQEHESSVIAIFYEDWNQALMDAPVPWLPEKERTLATGFREFVKGDMEAQLQKYRIDYIVSEGEMEPSALQQLPHLQEKAIVGKWHVYVFSGD